MLDPSISSDGESKTRSNEDLGKDSGSSSILEDCSICCDQYETEANNWQILKCSHKICVGCYNQVKKNRTTMSGETHFFVKCPFCQGTSGVEIGTCPNGTMTVDIITSSCQGYELYGSIRITYSVTHPRYPLYRTAYLPNNAEGVALLQLMRIAWDRRLSFTIGTSVTTGADNVLVWNIHHKTSQTGGSDFYGFPDPDYFKRLKLELSQFGIE